MKTLLSMKLGITLAICFYCTLALSQWDADAGLYLPASQGPSVSKETSSPGTGLAYINDGNTATQWVSDPPLPSRFLTRSDLNLFRDSTAFSFKSSGIADGDPTGKLSVGQLQATTLDTTIITDGNLYGMSRVKPKNGSAWLKISFTPGQTMLRFYGRFRSETDDISLYRFDENGDSTLMGTISPNTYDWQYWTIPGGQAPAAIGIYSNARFQINEIGALKRTPMEYVIMDLGSLKAVNEIVTRHYNSQGESTQLFISTDKENWVEVGSLSPDQRTSQSTSLGGTYQIRYIKLVQELGLEDHAKAYIWEIIACDPSKPFGPMPAPAQANHNLREIMGVNAFWGWGYNRYTDGLQPGEGPEMYTPVASFARDYHKMDWDIVDPDDEISFTTMAASGTPAQYWLDWDREYQAWIDGGMPVQAAIQFVEWEDTAWNSPYTSGYKYGFSFGRYFGPTYGNGKVPIVEVGNEPWSYDSTIYRTILRGMAKGLKDADPAITVLPCALQAYEPANEARSYKNYMGARITSTEAQYLDGINIHPYSFYKGLDGRRIAVHPEHIGSGMRGVISAVRWRDQNMPGKGVYVTEWGWDSDGAGQFCLHNECVTEDEATAYVTRGLMMLHRLGVDQATYFYHSNLWGTTLFTRSGLTGSKEVNYVKKKSFYSMEALINQLGDSYFLDTLREDDQAWMYLYGDSLGNPTHLVAWRPIQANDTSNLTVTWATSYEPLSAVKLDGSSSTGRVVTTPTYAGGQMTIPVNVVPTIIKLSGSVAGKGQMGYAYPKVLNPQIPYHNIYEAGATSSTRPDPEDPANDSAEDPAYFAGKQAIDSLLTNTPREAELVSSLSPAAASIAGNTGKGIDFQNISLIEVWDITGRKLMEINASNYQQGKLELDRLVDGYYHLITHLRTGEILREKVVVRR